MDLGIGEVVEPASPPMYLATSLGIGRADASAGNVEEYYKRMVALNYFKRAAQAAPEDSHVLAAPGFLWEIKEDKEDCSVNDHTQIEEDKVVVEVQKTPFEEEKELVSPSLHLVIGVGIDVAFVGGINAADFGKGGNTEDLSNRLFLRNYAQFLYQSKRDLQGAEQYYSRAVLADPADGEIISQYAKLVWELHRDQDKAMSYFERAVQATPEDSHEDGAVQDHIQAPLFLRAMTAANGDLQIQGKQHVHPQLGQTHSEEKQFFLCWPQYFIYNSTALRIGQKHLVLDPLLLRLVLMEDQNSSHVLLQEAREDAGEDGGGGRRCSGRGRAVYGGDGGGVRHTFTFRYKGDLHGTEEYYLRATLADPKDVEILLLYANLVWKLHQDQDRALNYFKRAAQAAPEDSHVLAAPGFLWEIKEDKEDCSIEEDDKVLVELLLGIDVAVVGGINAADFGKGGNTEDYYKRMVEENPSNRLFLRNYAQFLYQSKRDLQGAEQYYSRAVLADPADGEIISQYAKLVWELHRDQDKAVSYFERVVQATPEDS
ncbi:unnamed protein product [Camellia sinensis]